MIDPLWAPLLSHYRPGAPGRIDPARMAAQIRFVRPWLSQFLLAGSTGDGWELDDAAMDEVVALASDPGVLDGGARVLFGALRPSTDGVVARAVAIERRLTQVAPACEVVGLAVCPPVDPRASQDAILAHFRQVIDATRLPIAVYQLPQVTHCAIAPDTMRALAANPRVVMFKDSGGADDVVRAGAAQGAIALRGAEGSYAAALDAGGYDGWLLSSANAFPRALRRMADALGGDEVSTAETLSSDLTRAIERLFAAVAGLPFGNAFSNANRAADHVLAHGARWRETPATTISGAAIPAGAIEAAAAALAEIGPVEGVGYLDG